MATGQEQPAAHESPWFAAQHVSPEVYEGSYRPDFAEGEPQPRPEQALEQELMVVPAAPDHGHAGDAEGLGLGSEGVDSNAELRRDTAAELRFQRPNGRAFDGVAADRTGGSGRVSVQVRLPLADEQAAEAGLSADDGEVTTPPEDVLQELAGEGEPEQAVVPADLKGIGLVEFYYRALGPQEQAMSANSLAPVFAARTGYKVGTVRKYLGAIKKA